MTNRSTVDSPGRGITRVAASLLTAYALTAPLPAPAASVDTRAVSLHPKEIYGPVGAPIAVRIGNGGAGPTGILRALAEDYLAASGLRRDIAWYQDISPNTLRQLRAGRIDVALVYERGQREAAVAEGFATQPTLIFNDHFVVAGPRDNPAGLSPGDAPLAAFKKIAAYGARTGKGAFLSRDDRSGTNEKERSIWRAAGLAPWRDAAWYRKDHVFPRPALIDADRERMYTLSDHGTWLSASRQIADSRVFLMGGDLLRNPCTALLGRAPSPAAQDFLRYLRGPRAQALIANFGRARYGEALFTNAGQLDFPR